MKIKPICILVDDLGDGYGVELRFGGGVDAPDRAAVAAYIGADRCHSLRRVKDTNDNFPELEWAEGCGPDA
jgi:hypothetical protein